MITRTEATIEDLYRVPDNGKAEIVDGELVLMIPSGGKHGRAFGKIHISLSHHEESFDGGFAFADNVGFIVNLPSRKSFSPDAAWFDGGPEEIDMDFVDGSPVFAVEVRSKITRRAGLRRSPGKSRTTFRRAQRWFGTLIL